MEENVLSELQVRNLKNCLFTNNAKLYMNLLAFFQEESSNSVQPRGILEATGHGSSRTIHEEIL